MHCSFRSPPARALGGLGRNSGSWAAEAVSSAHKFHQLLPGAPECRYPLRPYDTFKSNDPGPSGQFALRGFGGRKSRRGKRWSQRSAAVEVY